MCAMYVDPYPVLARQGRTLTAMLTFVAAAVLSAVILSGMWVPGAEALFKVMSLTPGVLATLVATLIATRLWSRIVVDGTGFAAWKGLVSGALSAVLTQIITIWVFLAVAYGFFLAFEPDSFHLEEFPGLVLMAPLYSFGLLTVPVGAALGLGVAVYLQRQLNRLR